MKPVEEMSRREIDDYRRNLARSIFPALEQAYEEVYAGHVELNEEKWKLLLDMIEMDLPAYIGGSVELSETDKDGINSLISLFTRMRTEPMGQRMLTGQGARAMISMFVAFEKLFRDGLEFLEVRTTPPSFTDSDALDA